MSAFRNKLMLAASIAALGAGSLATAGVAQAKHGADDPVAHNAGDDHGGLRAKASRHGRDDRRHRHHAREARHGRDDRPGDDHGSR